MRELLALPGQVVPGSYRWAPDGHAVVFLVQPGTGPQTAVCVLEPAAGSFRYLGDLVPDGSSSVAAAAAPVTWDGTGSALYSMSAAPAASEETPLFSLQPIVGPQTTLGLSARALPRESMTNGCRPATT